MTYFGFKTIEEKNKWICKSEINRSNMRKMGIPDNISLDDIKCVFETIHEPNYVVWMLVGNQLNKNQRKHVKYVLKSALYHRLIKR